MTQPLSLDRKVATGGAARPDLKQQAPIAKQAPVEAQPATAAPQWQNKGAVAQPAIPFAPIPDDHKRSFSYSLNPHMQLEGEMAEAAGELSQATQAVSDLATKEAAAKPQSGFAKLATAVKDHFSEPSAEMKAAQAHLVGAQAAFTKAKGARDESNDNLKMMARTRLGPKDAEIMRLTDRIAGSKDASGFAEYALKQLKDLAPMMSRDTRSMRADDANYYAQRLGEFHDTLASLNEALKSVSKGFPSVPALGTLGTDRRITTADSLKEQLQTTLTFAQGELRGDTARLDQRLNSLVEYVKANVTPVVYDTRKANDR